jgi:hypothetical protein
MKTLEINSVKIEKILIGRYRMKVPAPFSR